MSEQAVIVHFDFEQTDLSPLFEYEDHLLPPLKGLGVVNPLAMRLL
jgi:hypothetical protein